MVSSSKSFQQTFMGMKCQQFMNNLTKYRDKRNQKSAVMIVNQRKISNPACFIIASLCLYIWMLMVVNKCIRTVDCFRQLFPIRYNKNGYQHSNFRTQQKEQQKHQWYDDNLRKHTSSSKTCSQLLLKYKVTTSTEFAAPEYTMEDVQNESKTKTSITIDNLKGLEDCRTATQARRILDKVLLEDNGGSMGDNDRSAKEGLANKRRLYRSTSIPPGASVREISDGDLAIQTRLVNKRYKKITDFIEWGGRGDRDVGRASAVVVALTIFSFSAATTVNQILPGPDVIRFGLVWILTFLPLAFVGYGIKDNSSLQRQLIAIQRMLFPSYRKRMIQHEAGHFLMGHLLGWPVASYQTDNSMLNAVEFYPLSDADRGSSLARQLGFDKPSSATSLASSSWLDDRDMTKPDVPFFSSEGRGALFVEQQSVYRKEVNNTQTRKNNLNLKLRSQDDPTTAWPFRGFDDRTLDQLAVISVAGVCAELLAFGNAEGGNADLYQLKQIFNSAADGTKMSDRDAENRIRYALAYAISQLRLNLGALDALAEVMERNGSIADCVCAIENCRDPSGRRFEETYISVSTPERNSDDYEVRRREAFREQNLNLLERMIRFFGNDKTIDTVEDRFVTGEGGGGIKKDVRLPGDDPLYAAIAVSLAFLAWASSGGLTLH